MILNLKHSLDVDWNNPCSNSSRIYYNDLKPKHNVLDVEAPQNELTSPLSLNVSFLCNQVEIESSTNVASTNVEKLSSTLPLSTVSQTSARNLCIEKDSDVLYFRLGKTSTAKFTLLSFLELYYMIINSARSKLLVRSLCVPIDINVAFTRFQPRDFPVANHS